MEEDTAEALAKILNGETWQSGGGMWVVVKRTSDGRLVTFTDESVVEYEDEDAFEDDTQKSSIVIA